MADEVRIKKVNAYPFPAQLKLANGTSTGQIVKLTQTGFLIEISLNTLQPGEKFECTFEMPVVHTWITSACVLIKLYNQWAGKPAGAAAPVAAATVQTPGAPAAPAGGVNILRLAEFHFVDLPHDALKKITAFLTAVNKGKNS